MNLQEHLMRLVRGGPPFPPWLRGPGPDLQARVVAILLRWPWDDARVPHAGDIQGELRRQGGEAPLPAVVAALEALARHQALRLGPGRTPGNVQILEVFPARLAAWR